MAEITEIVDGIYRICSLRAGQSAPVGFNQFLIDDEHPTLIHTGYHESYETVRAAVAEVLDPRRLAYVVLAHFESDECGGMDRFLADAPSSVLVASELGATGFGYLKMTPQSISAYPHNGLMRLRTESRRPLHMRSRRRQSLLCLAQ
jgi:flavorubredoxin